MSNFRFYLIFIAMILLVVQVWNQQRDTGVAEWVWMFLMAAVIVGIWLGTRRLGPGGWRHARKTGVALLAVGLVGSAALLCTAARV